MLGIGQCFLGSLHLSQRKCEIIEAVSLVLIGQGKVVQASTNMRHIVCICRKVVVEESALCFWKLIHKCIAAICNICKRNHFSSSACYDAVHLIRAFYSERASWYGFITYIGKRIGRKAAPLVVDLLDGTFVTQVLKYVLTVETSWEVALLLAPIRIIEVVIKVGYFLCMLLSEVLLAIREQEVVGVVCI